MFSCKVPSKVSNSRYENMNLILLDNWNLSFGLWKVKHEKLMQILHQIKLKNFTQTFVQIFRIKSQLEKEIWLSHQLFAASLLRYSENWTGNSKKFNLSELFALTLYKIYSSFCFISQNDEI